LAGLFPLEQHTWLVFFSFPALGLYSTLLAILYQALPSAFSNPEQPRQSLSIPMTVLPHLWARC
jgi:hypothetical protein